MDLHDYQKRVIPFRIYPEEAEVTYPAMGLAGEVGELLNKLKKTTRDGVPYDTEALRAEIGDCLWYLAALACDLGISIDVAAEQNLAKLEDRKQRNKLQGNGDNR